MSSTSRIFDTGAWAFQVTSGQRSVCDWVEGAFQDLPNAGVANSTIDLSFNGTQFVLIDEAEDVHRHVGLAIAHALVHHVNQRSLDHEISSLHLHAGGVGHEGQALVMSGPSGTGKSTLTAQFCDRGWAYLSDEAVRLSEQDEKLRGFPKPISFKAGSVALLPELAANAVIFENSTPGGRHLVPASHLGATSVPNLEPAMVAVLHRNRDNPASEPSIHAIDPADAVVRLVEQTMDFDRYEPTPLLRVARTAASSWCATAQIGPPQETVRLLERAFHERPAATPSPVEELQPSMSDDEVLVNDGVVSVGVGQSVVVNDPSSRSVFSLHDEAAEIWHDLLRGSLGSRGGREQALLQQLETLGVVQR